MPIDRATVEAALAKGFTFVCATCRLYHEARVRGLEGCLAAHRGDKCFGPFKAGAYPKYDGVIPRNRLHSICFACGARSTAGIEIKTNGEVEIIGICDKHLPLLDSMSAGGDRPPFVTNVHVPVLDP